MDLVKSSRLEIFRLDERQFNSFYPIVRCVDTTSRKTLNFF